ncbi:redoxin family protein [Pedobacter deserti]|uniref:redoxin family protein n=1 Tax=Pedobacter deserti TaxID=2817382 RepID=UPI00210E0412|nr:redoxin family protein [Pedobacter sp. SYSU D00382]
MKKLVFKIASAILIVASSTVESSAQTRKTEIITDKNKLLKLRTDVERNPDSLSYHQKYIEAMGLENPKVTQQYAVWMSKFPKNANIPYAIAEAYLGEEDPKAKSYLLKAVEINPSFSDAWAGLWIDGERWGDFKLANSYLKKATETDPSNPSYAFYYANSFYNNDKETYEKLSLDVVSRFPSSERGAQALYWLATRSNDPLTKRKYYEMLKKKYSPQDFNWSASGMPQYFELLLSHDPASALSLAKEMESKESGEDRQWQAHVDLADRIVKAKNLLKEGKVTDASEVLDNIKLSRRSRFGNDLILLKAQAAHVGGNTLAAYESIIKAFVTAPTVRLMDAIKMYGKMIGKDDADNEANIFSKIDAQSELATPFIGLKRYLNEGTASLSDFKGKVLLLTYWFPGCGPCRGEFPHFENVIRKFTGKDVDYVGINIVSRQNDYVVPFMKSTRYSFTPLEDVEGRNKGNLDNGGAAPVNFLIDKNGYLTFSDFRTDGDNEEDLELMINLLLRKKS